jgi:serine/threonine protein kinase
VRSEPDIDRRCDLWAAGVVLYEALVGRPAFVATNDFDTMQEVVSGSWGDAEGRELLPDHVRLPMKRCLAVSRDKRYPTARALRAALELAAKRTARADEEE